MKSNLLNGVLDNFLGTYTSRYSDYEGYWLFAIMSDNLDGLEVDLLGHRNAEDGNPHITAAHTIAVQKFREQMEKSGLREDNVREALLIVSKMPKPSTGMVNGRVCSGWMFRFVASATGATQARYKKERTIFVAPHDPTVETRSARPAETVQEIKRGWPIAGLVVLVGLAAINIFLPLIVVPKFERIYQEALPGMTLPAITSFIISARIPMALIAIAWPIVGIIAFLQQRRRAAIWNINLGCLYFFLLIGITVLALFLPIGGTLITGIPDTPPRSAVSSH